MSTVNEVRPWGVRLSGRWYWNEALYGLRGTVLCRKVGDTVEIYGMDMKPICTAVEFKLEA